MVKTKCAECRYKCINFLTSSLAYELYSNLPCQVRILADKTTALPPPAKKNSTSQPRESKNLTYIPPTYLDGRLLHTIALPAAGTAERRRAEVALDLVDTVVGGQQTLTEEAL